MLYKGPSTKYDHFMRVCTNKNEEDDFFSTKSFHKNPYTWFIGDHPQSTTTLWEFVRTKMKKINFFPLKVSVGTLIHDL